MSREAIHNCLDRLNSVTKYPSIPTYHPMDDKGNVLDGPDNQPYLEEEYRVTEKIDGTNARIIQWMGCTLMGSREQLLWGRGDLIHNPAEGIVDVLRDVAMRLPAWDSDGPRTWYFEVYGGKSKASRVYTNSRLFSHRLIDIQVTPGSIMDLDVEEIARWRESSIEGDGRWMTPMEVMNLLVDTGLAGDIVTVPPLGLVYKNGLPQTIEETMAFLKDWTGDETRASIDAAAPGRPEGVVLKSMGPNRLTHKIRYEDYERTLHRMAGAKK